MIIIYAALAVPLRSYGLPVIIMTVIPFGLVGAVLGHLILGLQISILSVMDGAVRRFRPVILTSVAFGVLFATVVTLILVPVLYFVGRDLRTLFAARPAQG